MITGNQAELPQTCAHSGAYEEQAKQRTSRAKHSQGETGDKGTMDGEDVVTGVCFFTFLGPKIVYLGERKFRGGTLL